MTRRARAERTTSETSVVVEADLGGGDVTCTTGVPFFDHMLDQLGRHAGIGLRIETQGDLEVDAHHTVEDTGIALGQVLAEALGDKAGIARYGDAIVPMEEALVVVAVDISGRPLLAYDVDVPAEMIGQYETGLTEEFLHALTRASGLTLHVRSLAGRNAHHVVEAVFKGLAVALRRAWAVDPSSEGVIPSTKGVL